MGEENGEGSNREGGAAGEELEGTQGWERVLFAGSFRHNVVVDQVNTNAGTRTIKTNA